MLDGIFEGVGERCVLGVPRVMLSDGRLGLVCGVDEASAALVSRFDVAGGEGGGSSVLVPGLGRAEGLVDRTSPHFFFGRHSTCRWDYNPEKTPKYKKLTITRFIQPYLLLVRITVSAEAFNW